MSKVYQTEYPVLLKGDWEATVEQVDFTDLSDLSKIAKREGLSFKPTQKTDWFALHVDGELAGCTGLIWPRSDKARIKSTLIIPEWRGLGGFRVLNRHTIHHALNNGAQEITVITRQRNTFVSYGFKQMPDKNPPFMHIMRAEAETLADSM